MGVSAVITPPMKKDTPKPDPQKGPSRNRGKNSRRDNSFSSHLAALSSLLSQNSSAIRRRANQQRQASMSQRGQRSQSRGRAGQGRPPPRKRAYVQKAQQPTGERRDDASKHPGQKVDVPIQNKIQGGGSAFSLVAEQAGPVYALHPGNVRLFPNLSLIHRNFQQFRYSNLRVQCQPLASTLASGAYVLTTVPNQAQTAFDSNALPTFASMINYASSTVSTIWRPLVYSFARDILSRLNTYLMQGSAETDNPGSLVITAQVNGQGNAEAPLMPIFTIKGTVHFRDFRPAVMEPDAPLQYQGSTYNTVDYLAGSWVPSLSQYGNRFVPSKNLKWGPVLGTFSGFSGYLYLAVQATTSSKQSVSFLSQDVCVVNGTSFATVSPVHRAIDKVGYGVEGMWRVPIQGSVVVSWGTTIYLSLPGNLTIHVFAHPSSSMGAAMRFLRHAIKLNGSSAQIGALTKTRKPAVQGVRPPLHASFGQSPPEPTPLPPSQPQSSSVPYKANWTPQFYDPRSFVNSFQHLSVAQESGESQPQQWAEFVPPKKEGWCWLRALLSLKPFQCLAKGKEVLLQLGQLQFRLPRVAFIQPGPFIRCLQHFSLRPQLQRTHLLVVEDGFGHLAPRSKPSGTPKPMKLQDCSSLGGSGTRRSYNRSPRLAQFEDEVPPSEQDEPPDLFGG